jgi:hypothetical protein
VNGVLRENSCGFLKDTEENYENLNHDRLCLVWYSKQVHESVRYVAMCGIGLVCIILDNKLL